MTDHVPLMESGVEHRFGPYGGQYVPETLMPALAELEAAWIAVRGDPSYKAELDRLLRDFAGRPTPLYLAERLSERAGREIWLKREDLMHTGSHKLNNALGQALLAKRMGKHRIIAETGAGQHGVATATACALLGLECIVYMGAEDCRRQAPNVERMGLLGAEVVQRPGRRPHAEGGRQRGDPRLGLHCRHDALHHRLGRRPGPVPRARARPAARHRRRVAPRAARARRAPARPRHRLRRRRLELDRHLHAVRRRSRRRADRRRGRGGGDRVRPARRAADGRRARRRAAWLAVGGHAGRRRPGHRGALDLGRPGLPRLRSRARPPARLRPRALRRRRGLQTPCAPSARSRGWRGSSRRSRPRTRCTTRCTRTATARRWTSSACRAAATRTSPRSSPTPTMPRSSAHPGRTSGGADAPTGVLEPRQYTTTLMGSCVLGRHAPAAPAAHPERPDDL